MASTIVFGRLSWTEGLINISAALYRSTNTCSLLVKSMQKRGKGKTFLYCCDSFPTITIPKLRQNSGCVFSKILQASIRYVMPFRLSVVFTELKSNSFLSAGRWSFLRAKALFCGRNKFVFMGLGILVISCPVINALCRARFSSHWLQAINVLFVKKLVLNFRLIWQSYTIYIISD